MLQRRKGVYKRLLARAAISLSAWNPVFKFNWISRYAKDTTPSAPLTMFRDESRFTAYYTTRRREVTGGKLDRVRDSCQCSRENGFLSVPRSFKEKAEEQKGKEEGKKKRKGEEKEREKKKENDVAMGLERRNLVLVSRSFLLPLRSRGNVIA